MKNNFSPFLMYFFKSNSVVRKLEERWEFVFPFLIAEISLTVIFTETFYESLAKFFQSKFLILRLNKVRFPQ